MPHILLQTERLTLRRFTPADLERVVALDADPEVMRYLSGGAPTSRHVIETQIFPRLLTYDERRPHFGFWAAMERDSGEFLGWFTFRLAQVDDPTVVKLGFRLRRAAWGQGYATEGARALIRLGFTEGAVQRVTATAYEHNAASRRVLEKVGLNLVRRYRMTLEELMAVGTFQVTPGTIWDGDDCDYALEKRDWERGLADHSEREPAPPV